MFYLYGSHFFISTQQQMMDIFGEGVEIKMGSWGQSLSYFSVHLVQAVLSNFVTLIRESIVIKNKQES